MPLEAVAVAVTPRVRATTARMMLMVLRMGDSFCGYGSPGRLSRGLVGRVGRSADVEEATEPAGAEDQERSTGGDEAGRQVGKEVGHGCSPGGVVDGVVAGQRGDAQTP